MKVVVLDLELTQTSQKVIQIGAVAAHINSEKMALVDRFCQFVDPGEPLTSFIIELTGIQQEDVDRAETLVETFPHFKNWMEEIKPQLCVAWGGDWQWLYAEANETPPKRILDLKQAFLLLTSNLSSKNQARGLRGAMEFAGMEFEGQQHNAEADAVNTAYLMFDMIERFGILDRVRKEILRK